MESTAKDVSEHAEKVFSSLEKEFVRKAQKDMFLCSAKCLESDNSARDSQNCLEKCQRPFERLTSYITGEATRLQNGLERCSQDCQDKAQEKRGIESPEVTQSQFESCIGQCARSCIFDLPNWHKRIRTNISSNNY